MRIASGSKVVFLGDSVTDAGRRMPVGEGKADALGTGYVALVDAMLAVRHPETPLRIVNMGISGNTVRDLAGRWQTDVLDLRPDWLVIMVGINDIWRQFGRPLLHEQQVLPDEYESLLEDLVARTRPGLQGLLLLTPFFIEPNRADPLRARVDHYGKIVRKIAAAHEAMFLDTQAAFDRVLAHRHPIMLSADRIHPYLIGHMVIAEAVVAALKA